MTETDSDSGTLQCPHGARCGGCAFLGMPYADQLVRKREAVQRGFARYPELAALRMANVAGATPNVAYRSRAKLVFGKDGALGLFERDSHSVVDIPECRVLAPALARVAQAARATLARATPALDGLDLRLVDEGVLVTLIAPRGTPLPDLKRLASTLCAASPEVRSVAASFRESGAATVLGTHHVLLTGNDVERHHLDAKGPYHLAAHGAFTQAHLAQATAAHAAIERALRQHAAQRVLELYAGSGALSLRLASAGFELTAVEAFAPALAHAERAAREQALKLTTVSGPAERVLRQLLTHSAQFDALIVNPPRRGLSLEVRSSIAALGAKTLLYMSCDPATLARDLAHLRELGYGVQELWPFDMIPHSAAVECLVVARRGALPLPSVLYENESLIAVSKSGFQAISEAPGAPSLLERVRLLPGASHAVALGRQRLDDDCSGVCLFARDAAALPLLEQAFAAGTQTFVGLARGVSHKRGRIRRPVRDGRDGRQFVPASLRYLRESLRGGHSLLTVWPERCSPWHVRQLLAGVGHPILGDSRFGDPASNTFFEHRHGLDRSFVHCSSLTLALGTGQLNLEAPLPGELTAVLASLSEPTAAPG
jgi:23S rRNA (uracil1939-C5)-methyltransferase